MPSSTTPTLPNGRKITMPNLALPVNMSSSDLECVMLDIDPLDVRKAMGDDFNEEDLFYGDIPDLKYAQGAVAEKSAHLTLLFGIHPSPTYRRSVDAVLKGWNAEDVFISHVGHFPSRIDGQDYNCIIGHVSPLPNLIEGNARLRVLDHSDNFPDYKPHVTLAYVKGSADLGTWITRLDEAFSNRTYTVTGLNYGDV